MAPIKLPARGSVYEPDTSRPLEIDRDRGQP